MIADENTDRMRILRIASNPLRIRIMNLLKVEPSSAGKVTKALGISRQLGNHHLRILVEIGLVSESVVGTIKVYSITQKGVELLKELNMNSERRPREQRNLIDLALPWVPAAAACLVFCVSAIKYILGEGEPPSWLIGGAILGILTYFVLGWALRRIFRLKMTAKVT